MNPRILPWDGCINIRDLGGLKTSDGQTTGWKSIVRSDTPARLSQAGWAALYAYGIRTIITLRTHGMTEEELDFTCPYPDIARVQAPIEDITDADFVERCVNTSLWGTPLYFKDALQRWPGRHAAVISAVAQAQPGGVLFHCIRGHDRTGIISLLLLSIARVAPDEIIADYELSVDPVREVVLERNHSSVRESMLDTFAWLNEADYLKTCGASPAELAAVRQRLASDC